jgi:hypothetical protein
MEQSGFCHYLSETKNQNLSKTYIPAVPIWEKAGCISEIVTQSFITAAGLARLRLRSRLVLGLARKPACTAASHGAIGIYCLCRHSIVFWSSQCYIGFYGPKLPNAL